jgi:hypothetical protein
MLESCKVMLCAAGAASLARFEVITEAPYGWRVAPSIAGWIWTAVSFTISHWVPAGSGCPHSPAGPSRRFQGIRCRSAAWQSSWPPSRHTSFHLRLYALHSGLLGELKSPVWGRMYQRMADSTSPEPKILGLSGLIRDGNASAVAAAAPVAALVGDNRAQAILLLSIRDFFRATDTDSVTAIGHGATDSTNSAAFREAAAHALAAIHTATALPFLATLLDDSNQNLRIEAIGGMAAFANGLAVQTSAGMPSLAHLQFRPNAPYKTADTVAHLALGRQAVAPNEASYLSFWKTWWGQNRASLGY